ncbi:MAG: hypothetical protein RL375_652 [Pseudomonadota bacterium]|jgi:uncharacterized protein (TIGR02001 family)
MNKSFAFAGIVLAAATLAPSFALADDGISYNVGVVTDYRYRGISQTRLKPALQGGVDYTKGAFYVGTWASTIKWIKDAGGEAGVEWDIYGGYKGEISKDLTYDVGVLRYQYLKTAAANTFEIYGALTFGPGTVKYSHSTTNLFGFAESKNSGYLEASATYEVAGLAVTPHLGYQSVAKGGDFSYLDYSLTVGKEVAKGLTLTAAVVGADTKSIGGVKAYASPVNGKDTGRAGLVLGAKFAF